MLPSSVTDESAREIVCASLESLEEVTRAIVDAEGQSLWLVCKPGAEPDRVSASARSTLVSLGLPADVPIRLAIEADRGPVRRVRLEAVERIPEGEAVVRIRVKLEWEGRSTSAEVAGEPGGQVELRTTALATVQALERVTGQSLGLRLAGVKPLRAFDSEIMTVAFYRPGSPPGRYVGTVIVGPDPLHAAAAAVLNGLNRLVGLYLQDVVD